MKVIFNTAHGPYARGIFSTISVEVDDKHAGDVSRDYLLNIYKDCYSKDGMDEYFINIVDSLKLGAKNQKLYEIYPRLRNVIGTNYCHIEA